MRFVQRLRSGAPPTRRSAVGWCWSGRMIRTGYQSKLGRLNMVTVEESLMIERRVDELYSDAAERFSTYETVVHRTFCESMLEAFPDQDSEARVRAFAYAREKYGYLSPEEIAEEDASNADDGICSHGLDFWTCPRGCFG